MVELEGLTDMDYLKYMHFEKENMERYASDCDCDECELFRNSFENEYDYVAPFLEQFGLKVDDAVEIADNGIDWGKLKRSYTAFYCVKGTLDEEKIETTLGSLKIVFTKDISSPPVKIRTPHFFINIYDIYINDKETVIQDALATRREIEYSYNGEDFFISRRNFKPYVYNEQTEEETSYNSEDELYYYELKDIVDDIEIKFIY